MFLHSSTASNFTGRRAPVIRSAIFGIFVLTAAGYAQPKITIVGGTNFDLGELHTNSKVRHNVTLRNDGTDTLKIWGVSGSCGCTGTLLSKEYILPRDSANLEITFDPTKFSGPVEKKVSMRTNDPLDTLPRIHFTATVNKILVVRPEYLVFRTRPDSAGVSILTIRNAGTDPVKITGIQADAPEITWTVSSEEIPPNGESTITCKVLPTKPGFLKGNLTLQTSSQIIPSLSIRYFSYSNDHDPSGITTGGK